MKAYLFYGTQLVEEIGPDKLLTNRRSSGSFSGYQLGRYIQANHGMEIYNGGWLYAPRYARTYDWWRCDMTPCHIGHVPKEIRALALLLT
jgi:hypothetical protein